MAEFKKLSDVEIIETPMDTANVLIEENGVIKRVPKDEVGGIKVAAAEVGQTIVVKAVDENGNPTEWEAVDKVTSWNDLEDRPFDSKTYTVSNKSDLTNAVIVGSVIKVSDLTIPKESMANAIITIDNQQTFPVSDILNGGAFEGTDKYFACEVFIIVYEDNFTMGEYTFPESGIYLPYGSGTPQVDLTWTETKPLDTKYLPEALQFGEGEPIVVVPETTLTDAGIIGDYNDLIKVGNTCIVYFNGADYECVAYGVNGVILIGNGGLVGVRGGNNEPFLVTATAERGIALEAVDINAIEEDIITISVKAKPIKQIDEKYIPESVKGGSLFIIKDGYNIIAPDNAFEVMANYLDNGVYVPVIILERVNRSGYIVFNNILIREMSKGIDADSINISLLDYSNINKYYDYGQITLKRDGSHYYFND